MPPVTASVSVDPITIEPLFVKLGLAPDCWIVSFALTLIVPLFACTADAFVSAKAWPTVSVPWLLSCASRFRVPLVPTWTSITAPAALVRVPLVTCSTAP